MTRQVFLDETKQQGYVVAAATVVSGDVERLRRVVRGLVLPRDRLFAFYIFCADTDVPGLHRLARTISAWENQLLAYFTTGRASNGPTEAVNLLVKRIKRVGFGFRNFDN